MNYKCIPFNIDFKVQVVLPLFLSVFHFASFVNPFLVLGGDFIGKLNTLQMGISPQVDKDHESEDQEKQGIDEGNFNVLST